jgi:hypothetical protein
MALSITQALTISKNSKYEDMGSPQFIEIDIKGFVEMPSDSS